MTIDVSKLSSGSRYRHEYIATKSRVTFSVAAFGFQTVTVAHGLGYVPYVKAFYTYDNSKYFNLFAGTASYGLGGNGGQIENTYADATNFVVTIGEYNGSPISGTIYYRIYAEPQV